MGLAARRASDDVRSQTWIGLDNYRDLFTNKFFWNAFRNTVTIGIISTVPQLCMALGIAHLLNYRIRGRTFFRVAMLMPYATSLAAATVIFLELFDKTRASSTGACSTCSTCRLSTGRGRSGRARSPCPSIVTWRWTGYNALIYLAGMQAIDTSLYEAAAIDGASRWRQFLHVTLPGLRPDDPVHDRGVDDRRDPAVRRAAALRPDGPAERRLLEPVPDAWGC